MQGCVNHILLSSQSDILLQQRANISSRMKKCADLAFHGMDVTEDGMGKPQCGNQVALVAGGEAIWSVIGYSFLLQWFSWTLETLLCPPVSDLSFITCTYCDIFCDMLESHPSPPRSDLPLNILSCFQITVRLNNQPFTTTSYYLSQHQLTVLQKIRSRFDLHYTFHLFRQNDGSRRHIYCHHT
jgi:hypothetical protein